MWCYLSVCATLCLCSAALCGKHVALSRHPVVDKDGIVNIKARTNQTYGEVKTYRTVIDFESKKPSDSQQQHIQEVREAMAEWYDLQKHP